MGHFSVDYATARSWVATLCFDGALTNSGCRNEPPLTVSLPLDLSLPLFSPLSLPRFSHTLYILIPVSVYVFCVCICVRMNCGLCFNGVYQSHGEEEESRVSVYVFFSLKMEIESE
ncbi:hypothetical protein P3S68_023514 [Capsicum galapagoense]